ncbi:hypothetical protein [uncultured Limnobacter sp.]|uniref:hypothetical protein n=1 Tax=uncultured Limnobacter sp. TaxID=199681 RepID=UPI0032B2F778
MSEYDNTNKGALFINSYKEEGTNQPDMSGPVNIAGVEFKLAGWLREQEDGTKYFSLVATRKEGAAVSSHNPIGDVMGESPKAPAVELPPSSDAGKDDIPF